MYYYSKYCLCKKGGIFHFIGGILYDLHKSYRFVIAFMLFFMYYVNESGSAICLTTQICH